jgi:hypothetical protein
MNTVKILSCSIVLMLLSGCASYHVQRGALIGALSGAAVGAGLGYTVSDPSLLGSEESGPGGNTSLPVGSSTVVGLAVGLVTGTIVGAMVGHRRDDGFEERPKSKELLEIEAREREQRAELAPHLRPL